METSLSADKTELSITQPYTQTYFKQDLLDERHLLMSKVAKIDDLLKLME